MEYSIRKKEDDGDLIKYQKNERNEKKDPRHRFQNQSETQFQNSNLQNKHQNKCHLNFGYDLEKIVEHNEYKLQGNHPNAKKVHSYYIV